MIFLLFCLIVSSKITLWRFKDNVLGPRLLPNYLKQTENCILMKSKTVLFIDVEKQTIKYNCGQTKQLLGSSIIYVVQ